MKLKQAKDTRKQYAAHMRQMAGLMQSVADTSVQLIRLGGRQEKQIVRALAGEGIIVQDIYLLRGQEDRLEISISVFLRREKNMTVTQIAGYLSVLMDIRLVPEKRNPYFIGCEPVSLYFEEEPEFCCMTAAAVAVEENETVSGDSYSFFEEDGGLTMILSDGVGSGESASQDRGSDGADFRRGAGASDGGAASGYDGRGRGRREPDGDAGSVPDRLKKSGMRDRQGGRRSDVYQA